jgi:hypothetical protein
MAQTFLTHDIIAKEALMQLKNELLAGQIMYNGYDAEYAKNPNGWKVGSTINIKAPVYFRAKSGETISVVDIKEQVTTLAVDQRYHVGWRCSSQDLTLNIEAFSQRFVRPAVQALANYIDADLFSTAYKYIPNQIGTPGTTPKDLLTYSLANARLTDEAAPMSDRFCIVDPTSQAYLADYLKGGPQQIATKAIEQANYGPVAGFNAMYVSNNLPTHTCGTAAGTTLAVDDASVAEGDNTITVDDSANDIAVAFAAGDIITVDTVYACNPISGASRNYLRQFVITTAAPDTGTETVLYTIPGTSPWPIYSEGADAKDLPYQTVYGLPAQNDSVVCVGTASLAHKVNLAMHRNCFGFVMVPLAMPIDGSKASQITEDGYSLRVSSFWDGVNDVSYMRLDALWGRAVLNPFLGCRIAA